MTAIFILTAARLALATVVIERVQNRTQMASTGSGQTQFCAPLAIPADCHDRDRAIGSLRQLSAPNNFKTEACLQYQAKQRHAIENACGGTS